MRAGPKARLRRERSLPGDDDAEEALPESAAGRTAEMAVGAHTGLLRRRVLYAVDAVHHGTAKLHAARHGGFMAARRAEDKREENDQP